MMAQDYQPLPFHRLDSGARYFRPRQSLPERVTAADPAASHAVRRPATGLRWACAALMACALPGPCRSGIGP